MPCYRIVVVSVDFKVANIENLKAALFKLDYSFSESNGTLNVNGRKGNFQFDFNKGKINFERGTENKVNEIKREYSKMILIELTKKKKWFLKEKGANKFQVVKY